MAPGEWPLGTACDDGLRALLVSLARSLAPSAHSSASCESLTDGADGLQRMPRTVCCGGPVCSSVEEIVYLLSTQKDDG